MIAVVILLRILAGECRSGGNNLSNVGSFIILGSEEADLPLLIKITVPTIVVKKSTMKLSGVYMFLRMREKT